MTSLDERVRGIEKWTDDELLQSLLKDNIFPVIESNRRLRTSNERLTKWLIALTILVAVLTVPLAFDVSLKFYREGFSLFHVP